ncbi:uncharacterized protein Dyak_GE22935 [Drosophila yakuba]|uniref:G-protein coupled receptors family 1 profile domain-containing protein n=1 Tax=Drosophila yakuba TaxID=7245 RepID=B4ITK6_DROYA|nr:uncharacterized protein Dyak_GE22935 [Drosophila yakuba]
MANLSWLSTTASTTSSSITTSQLPLVSTTNWSLTSPGTTSAILADVAASDDDRSGGIIHNQFVQIFFYVLYATVFVLGVFGNVLVCYVVLRNRAMQTVTNIFITNLALSDILLCVLAVPFTPLYTFMGRWAFGRSLCHLVSFAQGCSIYISTLTLTSIAIDRYFNWPSEQYRKGVRGPSPTTLQFVLPFFIISICYVWISVKLNQRARAKPGSKSSRREEADRDRKKRTNRMLIAMVAVFGLSWLPINVVNIFDDFDDKSNEWRFYILFFFVAHSIAMSSTCYNPFLYAWLNENFRKEFKHVLPCFNPSNNNIINITRGYNRSDRNTCGPRLHHGKGDGGLGGGSLDADDQDENGITQETCLPKEKLLIIPREPTYGNGTGAVSPILSGRGINAALVHGGDHQMHQLQPSHHQQVELTRRIRRRTDETDGDYLDSGDEQTVEVRFSETPFVSTDNTTGISILETSTSHCQDSDVMVELGEGSAAGGGGELGRRFN